MISPNIFMQEIRDMVSQNYRIEFLGNGYCNLTEKQAEKIYNWTRDVIAKKMAPALTQSKKKYKLWEISKLLSFVKNHQSQISSIVCSMQLTLNGFWRFFV